MADEKEPENPRDPEAEESSSSGDDADVSLPPPSIRAVAKQLYRNWMSYVGGLVMVGALAVIVFAVLSQLTVDEPSPYAGIFTYLIFPAVLVVGLLLFLWGMRRESKRRRREGGGAKPYPVINFNRPEHRRLLGYLTGAGILAFGGTGTATYNAYHYTSSTEFCGTVCHTPMGPEYTAYLDSPHAHVDCVDCHVGTGASFYVKSKINGAMQMIELFLDTYNRPIPIHTQDLRPAQDTCEKCHWSSKSWGSKLKQIPHFRYDEANTAEQISFTVFIGGGSETRGDTAGIHWHMAIDNEVTYAALDTDLQKIPWTEVKYSDGTVRRYVSRSYKLSQEKLATLETHRMDCIDCHNRPAHVFPVPDRAIDQALHRGSIDASIPWIKKATVDSINLHADDPNGSGDAVARDVKAHYQNELPEVWSKRQADIEAAAAFAARVWKRSAFPEMKLNWKTYPSNIGHRYWAGCFRCHDGKHESADGKVLEKTCDGLCHTAPARGKIEPLGFTDPNADTEKWHPWEMPKEHLEIRPHQNVECQLCHDAGTRPASECRGCHESYR
jgi:hypothetical protein